ncbi:unnamed protein product [Leptidea sinapis]|uniref:Cadherin domain-containing protein n=1 Tax=Leptidea sinapis TaxID=189913 RepID=A0A5E4QV05_9NEOP|nr:unnamed protein product [Leptidea sinapis]
MAAPNNTSNDYGQRIVAVCQWKRVTKFIRIGIADKNDNPPYFDKDLYEAEVDENEDIQHTHVNVQVQEAPCNM